MTLLHPIFMSLSDAGKAILKDKIRLKDIRKAEVILSENDYSENSYFIIAGLVRVETRVDGGPRQLSGFLHPLAIYLESFDSGGFYSSNTLRAVGPVALHTVPLSVLREVILENPRIGILLLQRIVGLNASLKHHLRRIKVESVAVRVALAVHELSEHSFDGTLILNSAITQADIAEYSGVSREAVNKAIKNLMSEGGLRKTSRGLEVVNKSAGSPEPSNEG
jgi:CRP-like cAMP-binding protein